MRSEFVIGLDVGTSSIKAIGVDSSGMAVGPVRVPTPTTRYDDGRVEHGPEELWSAVAACLSQIAALVPGTIRGIAVATVGEAVVPIDEDGRELRPIIAWHDRRGSQYADPWRRDPGAQEVYAITGQTVDELVTVNKILWMRDEEPKIDGRTRYWLDMLAWVNYRLCGNPTTDRSIASRSMLLDRRSAAWDPDLLRIAGIRERQLPEVVAAGSVIGRVKPDPARECGLPPGTPVVAGGHDHLCGALSARCGSTAFVDSVGSAEALIVPIEDPIAGDPGVDAHINCYPDVVSGQFVLSARVGLAGALIDWAARGIYGIDPSPEAYKLMFRELEARTGPSGLMCLPEFGRGASPRWNPEAALGAFAGLTLQHDRADMVHAMVEALCFSLRQNIEWMADHGLESSGPLRVEGGPAQSSVWMQTKADVLGTSIERVDQSESTARGAALLAYLGTGAGTELDELPNSFGPPTTLFRPDMSRKRAYLEIYERGFLPLAERLAPVHLALGDLERSRHDA